MKVDICEYSGDEALLKMWKEWNWTKILTPNPMKVARKFRLSLMHLLWFQVHLKSVDFHDSFKSRLYTLPSKEKITAYWCYKHKWCSKHHKYESTGKCAYSTQIGLRNNAKVIKQT